jgi:hypothetical protein
VISLLGIAFVRFTIKNLNLSVGAKNITLAFDCCDDGARFDELMIICLFVYFGHLCVTYDLRVKPKSVTLAFDR